MNIGAFVLVSVLEAQGKAGDQISSYRGLFRTNPALALPTAVFMISLAGFPPTAGFLAKYLAFQASVKAGHIDLVVVGVLTSLISVYYYFRVIGVMLQAPEVQAIAAEPTPAPADANVAGAEGQIEGQPEGAVAAAPVTATASQEERLPWNADAAAWTAVAGVFGLFILPTGFLNLAAESVTALRAVFGLP
jgi:NADH-quinone oxidoreductase subunit N